MFGRKGLQIGGAGTPEHRSEGANPSATTTTSEAEGCHPLVKAARIVALLSPPNDPHDPTLVTVDDIDHPTVCEARSGDGFVAGLSFSFVGERGEEGLVYMFPDFASIWPKGEQRPRPHIPADMLAGHVPQYSQAVDAVMHKIRPRLDPVAAEQSEWIRGQLKQFLG